MATHLFRRHEVAEEKELGKAVERGRRRALARFGAILIAALAFLLLFLGQVAAQGTFSPTGSMSTSRTDFTLTRLCDGKVLATGGSGPSGSLSSAELYNPVSGTWSATGSMTTTRVAHTATLLPDCRVLVTGGANASGILSSAELYDPVSGTWSATGSLSVTRLSHTAVLLNTGKVLVAAGAFQGIGDTFGHASAELYDPVSGTWSSTGSLATARTNQQGVLLSDGRVLIAGGMPRGVTFDNFASAEIYDPATGTWSVTGSMAIGRRHGFTLTLLPGGKVLVAGGTTSWTATATNKAELYDPATGTWTPTTPMPTTRTDHSATLLPDGTVLVVGGRDVGPGTILDSALIYDPVAGTWSPTAGTMGGPRAGHRDVRLLDGRVLIVGGRNSTSGLSTAELFGPVDTTPPVVNVSFPPPPDGQNGWFVTSPVVGSVTANDTMTGGSNITAIKCTGATVGTITGLGTPSASAPLTVSGEDVHNVNCTATDSASNSGAATGSSNTATVMIDTVVPSVTLNSGADGCSLPGNAGWCRGTQTAGFSASDATSGVVSPCAGAACDFTRSTTTNGSAVTIASGAVCDVAGNCAASIDAGPYMIDSVDPTVTHPGPDSCDVPGNLGWCRGTQTAGFSASDATSGVDSPPCAVAGSASCDFTQSTMANGSAVMIASGAVSDVAGNTDAGVNAGPYMIDSVAPMVTLNAAADSCTLPGNAGWCRGTQTAGFSASDATSGVASPCSGASCNLTQSTTTNGSAMTIASGAVCDVAGNCNAGIDAGPYMIDSAGPSISIVSPANGGTYILNTAVASSYSCSDETSGVATCSGPVASGANFSTSPVGAHAFTVNATDVASNSAQATNNYNVVYNFSGFFQPVDNPGPGPAFVFNTAKAGSAIPVKFSLNGDQGLNIFAADYPKSMKINCLASTQDVIEETVTAGESSLSYDATTDQYTYVWKTDKAWANCRQLIVRLNDGTDHVAYFKFTR